MYDHKNHVGRYTEEEVEQLRNLRAIHGNRWGTIGALMGRSAASVKDRVRVLRDNCNQGQPAGPAGELVRSSVSFSVAVCICICAIRLGFWARNGCLSVAGIVRCGHYL